MNPHEQTKKLKIYKKLAKIYSNSQIHKQMRSYLLGIGMKDMSNISIKLHTSHRQAYYLSLDSFFSEREKKLEHSTELKKRGQYFRRNLVVC